MKSRRVPGYETRIIRTTLAATLPLAITCIVLLSSGEFSRRAWWTTASVVAVSLFIATWVVRERLVGPIRTLSNLLAALREGDYSLRARPLPGDDALGEALAETNALRDLLQERRLEAEAATALLREVIAAIDSAILVFDQDHRLRLTNRAGERLLATPTERLLGETASRLAVEDMLTADEENVIEHSFPGAEGRFRVRSATFRDRGRPHRLLLIEDLSRALRAEERQAWQRLVRVLGHEINNSLAPIRSISDSLRQLAWRDPLPHDWRDDMDRGLSIVGGRADSLARFTVAYSRIAQLPVPGLRRVELSTMIERVASLETRVGVRVHPGATVFVNADPDQLEQALINLIRNAAEASLETGGGVEVSWIVDRGSVEIRILDEGMGVSNSGNLFVPFFTTKPSGSGVGLTLTRQIAEAHGGSVTLENRSGSSGCLATLTLRAIRS